MPNIEDVEMDRYRKTLAADVKRLVERYRTIFDWDVADINQARADRLILEEIRRALADIEQALVRQSGE